MVSLRGPEGFLLDLDGLNKFWEENSAKNYIYICLRGQVKGEHSIRCHLLPCVNETNTGVKVKESVERLMVLKQEQGFTEGPAISNIKGNILITNSVNDCMVEALESLFQTRKQLFPLQI